MCFRPAAVSLNKTCPECGFEADQFDTTCPQCGASLPAADAPGVPGAPGAPGASAAPGAPAAPGRPAAPGAPSKSGHAACGVFFFCRKAGRAPSHAGFA